MSDANKALLRRFYEEVINKKNVNAIDDICSADFTDHSPMPGQAPGVQGMKATMAQFVAAFPDMRLTVDEMVAEGDVVATRFSGTGTHTGELMGARPTNKRVTFHGIDMMRVRNGKAVEAYHYGDEMMVLMQIGVKMPA